MAIYTCPTCNAKMERDLLLFTQHTDRHIVDELKKKHPSWITEDGFCPRCLDHFKRSMTGGAGEPGQKAASIRWVNIGTREGKKRFVTGVAILVVTVLVFLWLRSGSYGKNASLALLPLFFGWLLCFFQVRRNLCVVLAAKGVRNMDQGEQPIANAEEIKSLRRESAKVIFFSLLIAAAATFFCYLIF